MEQHIKVAEKFIKRLGINFDIINNEPNGINITITVVQHI